MNRKRFIRRLITMILTLFKSYLKVEKSDRMLNFWWTIVGCHPCWPNLVISILYWDINQLPLKRILYCVSWKQRVDGMNIYLLAADEIEICPDMFKNFTSRTFPFWLMRDTVWIVFFNNQKRLKKAKNISNNLRLPNGNPLLSAPTAFRVWLSKCKEDALIYYAVLCMNASAW